MKLGARRLRWLIAGALALAILVYAGVRVAGSGTPGRGSVEVSATAVGRSLPSGFLGLSIEYNAIHDYLGRNADQVNPVFVELVKALNPGGAPVLRIGGDSTDRTWWPIAGVDPSPGVTYALTANWMSTVRAGAAALGARLILGINLAAGSTQIASAEADALVNGLGRNEIEALEVGNEPDVYSLFAWYRVPSGTKVLARPPDWSEGDFQKQFTQWASVLPKLPLAGPALAYVNWMSDLGRLIAAEPRLKLVTFHRYPLRGCGAQATGKLAPTVANLFKPTSSAGLAAEVAGYVKVAHAAGLPFRVDELNSASCGGRRGLSNTFASSLWMLDTLFNMAAVGVDGVNVHTLRGAAYAPFAFTERDGIWHATVNPDYYGMLMFSQAFPTGARLLKTTAQVRSGVKVWSTVDASGTVRTVVINESAQATSLSLQVANKSRAAAQLETLRAPSLHSTTGVTLGGVSFTAGTTTGVLSAPRTVTLAPRRGAYRLVVPADSAVLLTA